VPARAPPPPAARRPAPPPVPAARHSSVSDPRIAEAKAFLDRAIGKMTKAMNDAAARMDFAKASDFKKSLSSLESLKAELDNAPTPAARNSTLGRIDSIKIALGL
jgi:hypothetical protein